MEVRGWLREGERAAGRVSNLAVEGWAIELKEARRVHHLHAI